MYHKASISPLSATQISKILNGHSVRISAGNGHDIELSKEQLKKFAKAYQTGKAMTLAMDPYQIQNHQHLRGAGSGGSVGRINKYNKWVDALGARQVIDAGMSKGASSISGMGVGRVNKYNKWVDALGARQVIDAGMSKGASSISGMGVMQDLYVRANQKDARKASSKYGKYGPTSGIEEDDEYNGPLYLGSGVGRRKKYNKWVDALGARDLINAAMSKGASTILGSGLKKRGRPKRGGSLFVAGTP